MDEVLPRGIAAAKTAARCHPRFSRPPPSPPRKVLLIEDSPLASKMISRSIASSLGYRVERAGSLEEASRFLDAGPSSFMAAVTKLQMSGAPAGRIVDLAIEAGFPTVVLTGSYSDEIRRILLAKSVVDYHFKDRHGLERLNKTLRRLELNPGVKILLVDDSRAIRNHIAKMLRIHLFEVLHAADGIEALERIAEHPQTSLVITDYQMPKMDGIELVTRLRAEKKRDELAVIGISSVGTGISARFLKFGADDFLIKPFQKEEFYCRVYRCIETIENIRAIKKAAYTDALTGLGNRLFFFKKAIPLFEKVKRESLPAAVAMMDIDRFKAVNDTFGHAAGDAVLKRLAEILAASLPADALLARLGGEEFCCFAPAMSEETAWKTFERTCRTVEATRVEFEDRTIDFTISVGVKTGMEGTLDETINGADEFLYEAKRGGRNKAVIDGTPLGRGC